MHGPGGCISKEQRRLASALYYHTLVGARVARRNDDPDVVIKACVARQDPQLPGLLKGV